MAFLEVFLALGVRRIGLVGGRLRLLIGGIGLRLVCALRLAIARTCRHHAGRGANLRTLVRVIVGDFSHHGTRGGATHRAARARAGGRRWRRRSRGHCRGGRRRHRIESGLLLRPGETLAVVLALRAASWPFRGIRQRCRPRMRVKAALFAPSACTANAAQMAPVRACEVSVVIVRPRVQRTGFYCTALDADIGPKDPTIRGGVLRMASSSGLFAA